LIEPVVLEHDCELVDVEQARDRGQGLLRITVDSPEGDGRVSIERCVAISREVETLLDAADAMPGAYRLEVSSPGLDRLLGRQKDFVAAVGARVKLRTRRPIEGRRRFTGRLTGVQAGPPTLLRMDIDGAAFDIRFDDVEKANTVYEFSSADFGRPAAGDEPDGQAPRARQHAGQADRHARKHADRGKKKSSADRARRAR
jgi:ribosome maturation factor RimP